MAAGNRTAPLQLEETITEAPSRPRWRKLLIRVLVIIVAVFLIVDYLLLPIALAYVVTLPSRGSVGPTPDGFEAVTLTTSDQVELAAWYAAPRNGAAIVLIHGAGSSRAAVRPYAEMLVENGFGVLALDLRGHGASNGSTNKFGWDSTLDVGAAIRFLSEHEEVRAIGGLGISLGGETLLGAVSTYPTLAAVVADGATARSFEEFYALPAKQDILHAWSPWIMFRAVQLFTRQTPPAPTLLNSISEAETARFLLIAAGADGDEIAYNTLFAEAVNGRAELWIAPEVGHTGAFGRYPQEYEQRVVDFYQAMLLDGS